MRIKIQSVNCDDLPNNQSREIGYKPGQRLTSVVVGEEYDVLAVSFSTSPMYFIRISDDVSYLTPVPAALTEIIDSNVPSSWVVSHETKALHPKLPEHQVIFCPRDWLMPFFSMFSDLLDGDLEDDGRGERVKEVFLSTITRDYSGNNG